MLLSKYILDIFHDTGTYTPGSLEIDAALARRFRLLLTRSETSLREYGLSLEWHASRTVRTSANEFTGAAGGTAVNLDSANESQRFTYIGDFHTHPYRWKYGAGVAIGPSNGDWMQWFATPPARKSVAVHCVASGGELFVLIFRTLPQAGSAPDFEGITSDAGRLNDLTRENDDFAMAIYDATQRMNVASHARRPDPNQIRDAASTYLQAIRDYQPDAAQIHAEDAESMNIELSNRYHHEYFRGALLTRGTATVTLRSNRASGNWLTSRIWSSSGQGWFG